MQKERRNELNRKQFPSEVWFKKKLDARQLRSYRRNVPLLGRYFGDFVFREKKIVIEIDGKSHNGKEDYDKARDEFLAKHGYRVFRIKFGDTLVANQVLFELEKLITRRRTSRQINIPNPEKIEQRKIRQEIHRQNEIKNNERIQAYKSQKKRNSKIIRLRRKLEGCLSYARQVGGDRGNQFLSVKLKELGLTPEQAKSIIA